MQNPPAASFHSFPTTFLFFSFRVGENVLCHFLFVSGEALVHVCVMCSI